MERSSYSHRLACRALSQLSVRFRSDVDTVAQFMPYAQKDGHLSTHPKLGWRIKQQYPLSGSGSHENGRSFKVVAMEKKVQTSIVHEQGFGERECFANKAS